MASPSRSVSSMVYVTEGQGVYLLSYKGDVIVVPEEFIEDIDTLITLMSNQISAHDAVFDVTDKDKDTAVHIIFAGARGMLAFVNTRPVAREKLDYNHLGYPVSLLESKGLVKAGWFLTSARTCARLAQKSHSHNLWHLEKSFDRFLDRLCGKNLTYLRLPPDDNHIHHLTRGGIENGENISKPLKSYQQKHQDIGPQISQKRFLHPTSSSIASFPGIASSPQGCVSLHKSKESRDVLVELNAKTHTKTVGPQNEQVVSGIGPKRSVTWHSAHNDALNNSSESGRRDVRFHSISPAWPAPHQQQSYTLGEENTTATPAGVEFDTATEKIWTGTAPLNHYQHFTPRDSLRFPGFRHSAIDPQNLRDLSGPDAFGVPQFLSTGTKASLHKSAPLSRTEPLKLPLNQWTDDARERDEAFTFSSCQPIKCLRHDHGSITTLAVESTHSSDIVPKPFDSNCLSNISLWQVRKVRTDTSPQFLSTQSYGGNQGNAQQGVRLIDSQRSQPSLQETWDSEARRRIKTSFSDRQSYVTPHTSDWQSLGGLEPSLRTLEVVKDPPREASTPTRGPLHPIITESSWTVPYSI